MISKRYRCSILATCCLPWDEDYTFLEEVFRRQVRYLMTNGILDLYIFGTAGEGHAVSDRQFEDISRVFIEETGGKEVQGMIGIISLSLPTMIERIERARDIGARRFQISLPSWGALRDSELALFFREICDRFPDCEFLHYNLQRAQRLVSPAEYRLLADRHPNLVATKNSTSDFQRLRGLLQEAPQLQHFFTEIGFAEAAMLGECGLLISISSTNLAIGREFFEAGRKRDEVLLARLRRESNEFISDLMNQVGTETHMDGGFDKIFCRIHDPSFPLRLLPPYSSVSEDSFRRFLTHLSGKFPNWVP